MQIYTVFGSNFGANAHVGFKYADFDEMTARYNPVALKEGYNTMPDGEEIFYISNPALGLWAFKDRFELDW